MRVNLARRFVHVVERRAGQLELAARLERNRRRPGHRSEPDDVLALHDRFPAEQEPHAFEQRADAARSFVGNRVVAVDRKGEFLVLGADAELGLRLHALLQPRDQLVARLDRRHVDLVASHGGRTGTKGPRPYARLNRKSNAGPR
jgi:hypothetical protein